MKPIKLQLFSEVRSCKNCLFSWEGFASSFSRGHLVLSMAKKPFLFVPDDILYEFPKDIEVDFETLFEERGFLSIDRCPKCHSTELFGESCSSDSIQSVDARMVEANDTVLIGNAVKLVDWPEL